MNLVVPYISNTPGDKQCLQASYAMIRQYFDPALTIGWDEWADITGYLPGKGTWSMAGLMWFKEHGYDVVHIGQFDYGQFAVRGADYLIESLGEEGAGWELKNMDLVIEQARALRFLSSQVWVQKIASVADIKQYLDDGYLVKCLVNLNALNGKPGYVGHAVVVTGYTDSEIIMHDPGLPARPNRHEPIDHFLSAWSGEKPVDRKLDAIRRVSVPVRVELTGANSPEAVLVSGNSGQTVT